MKDYGKVKKLIEKRRKKRERKEDAGKNNLFFFLSLLAETHSKNTMCSSIFQVFNHEILSSIKGVKVAFHRKGFGIRRHGKEVSTNLTYNME